MKRIDHYLPPTPAELAQLKDTLGLSSDQMAKLAGLAQGGQWRKYTGTSSPRTLGQHMHFYMAALLTLPEDQLARVFETMREQGASLETAPLELRA
ncbi:XRE family transcriptional regulator [Pseudomonas aeruginosa]|uniref:XRE family transcriptional regulator n=1 Tax=Pseudomonas aeruginosa TaxID=287 RepID=UPI000E312EED|nr:XRE family transcriptional regulator [Pseudomonas aeruginosa]NPZ19496.1 XRE family transcriptional regulator [Pseudomonas aeruginosa]